MLSVQSAGVQANLCSTGVHLPLLAVTFKSLRALCPLPSHLPLLPVSFPLYLLWAIFISSSTFSQFLRTPWAGSNFNCSIKTIKRWLITKVFSFSASSLACFPFPLPTCVRAWRMRSLRLRVITSLSSLTMSRPSVYSLRFLYPSPCGLFMLCIRSLFISLHVAHAPLNKAVLFSSCCSCVFSWGLSLSSFPHINNPHGILLHK